MPKPFIFEGNVEGYGRDGEELYAENLTYDGNKDILSTDKAVVKKDGKVLTADEFDADRVLQKITARGHAKLAEEEGAKWRFLYTALAALAISAGAFGSVMADDITADVLTYDGKTKVVTAKGDVVIHANQGATITGAQGEYHFEDRSVCSEGGVRYVKEATTLSADRMYLYQDKTARGMGSVDSYDGAENRTLEGMTSCITRIRDLGKSKEWLSFLSRWHSGSSSYRGQPETGQGRSHLGGVNLTSSLHNAVG